MSCSPALSNSVPFPSWTKIGRIRFICSSNILYPRFRTLQSIQITKGWDLQKFQNPIKSIYCEFENYLKERKQFTSIKDVNSSLNDILCGVPQGSILGPILFLILITDLPNASKLFIILFVDDTTLQFSSEKLKSIYDFAHVELSKVADWFKANKLTLNAYKTKYILFRKKIKVLV